MKLIIAKNVFSRMAGCISFDHDILKNIEQSEIDKVKKQITQNKRH